MSKTNLTTAKYRFADLFLGIGADIVESQKTARCGSGFLKQLSADLTAEFPDMKGFSYRNIKDIRSWYLFSSEGFANWATNSLLPN